MHGRMKEIVSGGKGGGGMTKELVRAAKYSKVPEAVFQKSGGGGGGRYVAPVPTALLCDSFWKYHMEFR